MAQRNGNKTVKYVDDLQEGTWQLLRQLLLIFCRNAFSCTRIQINHGLEI